MDLPYMPAVLPLVCIHAKLSLQTFSTRNEHPGGDYTLFYYNFKTLGILPVKLPLLDISAVFHPPGIDIQALSGILGDYGIIDFSPAEHGPLLGI